MLKTYEGFRKGMDYSNKVKPYVIEVEYEHGDADFKTNKTFSFDTEKEMRKVLEILTKVRNFIPEGGYKNLGYYRPITGNDGGKKVEDIFDEDTFDKYSYYIERDRHYNGGYASIEGISLKIKGEPYILFDSKAAETNIIDLPKLGDTISIDPDEIDGYGEDVFGEDDYLPNSGKKDFNVPKFDAKVIDCGINESDYFNHGLTDFPYVILCQTDQKVLKSGEDIFKCTISMNGWDKDFGKKFGKDEFDNLRIYIL